jgi:hypothetical protein
VLETTTIRDPRAAAVFAAPRQRKLLLAVIEEARSLGELGRLTGTPLNLLHHHMGKFLRLGLVKIAREEARAGAPIKYYRATARSFFVPAELIKAEPGAGLHGQLRELLARSLSRTLQGVVYSHDGKGARMRLVKDADPRTAPTELWMDLHLNQADAAALAGELRAVLQRFEARSNKRSRRYLIHAAVAPF